MAYRLERMDPLAILIAPPENETQEQRQAREKKEALAHKTSLRIDEELKADKAAYRKKKNCVKVLVLGQSESGAYLVWFMACFLPDVPRYHHRQDHRD